MGERLNINAILCKDVDKEGGNIIRFFNNILMDNENTINFHLVILVSGVSASSIAHEENVEDNFTLYVYLKNKKENKNLFLGGVNLAKKDKSREDNDLLNDMNFSRVKIIEAGEHILEIYLYNESELKEKHINSFEDAKNKRNELRDIEHLYSAYTFNVKQQD